MCDSTTAEAEPSKGRDAPIESLLVAVRFDVLLGSVTGMLAGMLVMTVCQMGVVGSLLVVTGLMMLGGLAVMTGCVSVVLRRVPVMFCCFLGHM